jgi:hypothetical protein
VGAAARGGFVLDNLLMAFPDCGHGGWSPGHPFADGAGAGSAADRLEGELGHRPGQLLLPGRGRLDLRASGIETRILTPEVLAGRTGDGGEFVITWGAPHTLVGTIGSEGSVELSGPLGATCPVRDALASARHEQGVLVLATFGPLFALAIGRDADEAGRRALAGAASMPWQAAEARLARSCGGAIAEARDI